VSYLGDPMCNYCCRCIHYVQPSAPFRGDRCGLGDPEKSFGYLCSKYDIEVIKVVPIVAVIVSEVVVSHESVRVRPDWFKDDADVEELIAIIDSAFEQLDLSEKRNRFLAEDNARLANQLDILESELEDNHSERD